MRKYGNQSFETLEDQPQLNKVNFTSFLFCVWIDLDKTITVYLPFRKRLISDTSHYLYHPMRA